MAARTSGTHTAPTYLKNHPSGYIFRYCIPKDVQQVVKQTELRYPLRTGKLGLAKARARAMATAAQRIITRIRRGDMPELQTDQIHSLLKEWLKWALDTAEEHRIEEPPSQPLEERLRNLDVLEQFTKEQLVGMCPILEGTHKRDVEEHILKRHGLTADKESLAYKKLNRDYLKVYLRFIEILRNREQGDYSDEYVMIRWADDFVVLCRTRAEANGALIFARRFLHEQLGVELHPQKTQVVHVSWGVEFLGYKVKGGQGYRMPAAKRRVKGNPQDLYAIPKEKSVKRFKDQIRCLTRRRIPLKLREVVDCINPVIRGWGNYYRKAHVRSLYNRLDRWIERRLYSFLAKRWRNAKWRQYPSRRLISEFSLVRLTHLIHSLVINISHQV